MRLRSSPPPPFLHHHTTAFPYCLLSPLVFFVILHSLLSFQSPLWCSPFLPPILSLQSPYSLASFFSTHNSRHRAPCIFSSPITVFFFPLFFFITFPSTLPFFLSHQILTITLFSQTYLAFPIIHIPLLLWSFPIITFLSLQPHHCLSSLLSQTFTPLSFSIFYLPFSPLLFLSSHLPSISLSHHWHHPVLPIQRVNAHHHCHHSLLPVNSATPTTTATTSPPPQQRLSGQIFHPVSCLSVYYISL